MKKTWNTKGNPFTVDLRLPSKVHLSQLTMQHVICLHFALATLGMSNRNLILNKEGSFVVSQITDLHYGEGEAKGWGPVQDSESTHVMRTVLPVVKP